MWILAFWPVLVAGAVGVGAVLPDDTSDDTCEAQLAASERSRSHLAQQVKQQAARIRGLEAELRASRSSQKCPDESDAAVEAPPDRISTPTGADVFGGAAVPERRLWGPDDPMCYWIGLYSQADVDGWPWYGCTDIGSLYISGDITDLTGIGVAGEATVYWSCTIEKTTRLQNLNGLGNLTIHNEISVARNEELRSLEGFAGSLAVPSVLDIRRNPKLVSLEGLEGLQEVAGNIVLHLNNAQLTLRGLGDLKRVHGKLEIFDNKALTSIDDLRSITHVWGGIWIHKNPSLRTLQGLQSIEVTRQIRLQGNLSSLQVIGGPYARTAGIYIGALKMTGYSWPRCVAPQELNYLYSLQPPPVLPPEAAETWEAWRSNSCGPDWLFCWIGLPCEVDMAGSSFTGEAFLSHRTCGPCQPSDVTATLGAGSVANVTNLMQGMAPGNYSLCSCGSGPFSAGPVAPFSILGPERSQHFQCVRSPECGLRVVGNGLSPGDSVTVSSRCGGAEVPVGRAVRGADGEYRFTDRGAVASTLPNLYKVCWTPPCANASLSGCPQVEIGSLRITGPFVRDEGPFEVGGALSSANVGDGVEEGDRLRLLSRCGQPGADGPQAQSGRSMIFSLALGSSWARVRTYRKCWCRVSPLTPCSASEHFAADAGAVQLVCPAEREPTEAGECRSCPTGKAKSSPGVEGCAWQSWYLALLISYSVLLCSAFTTMFCAVMHRVRIEDISVVGGRTVLTTLKPHWLHSYGRKAFFVHFRGTAHPGLEKPQKPFRAIRTSPYTMELLNFNRSAPTVRLDTNRGYVFLQPRQELWHRGWPVPAAIAGPLLLLIALLFVMVFRETHSARDVLLGTAVALGVAAAARAVLALCSLRSRTSPLDRRIEEFRVSLLRANPQPTACEKGPGRAVELGDLFRVLEFFHAFIRDRTAYYMDGNIFGPITRVERLSYAEVVGPQQVQWFVSHFWGHSFSQFCSSLQKHAESVVNTNDWERVTYWICFISNNQYQLQDELGSSWKESSFFLTLQSGLCRGVCMVLDDLAVPMTRSWCIFELLQTLKLERSSGNFEGLLLCTEGGVLNLGHGSVEVAMNLAKRVATLDLENASASCESDKEMINNQVIQELGDFGALNSLIRQKMGDIIYKARENANESFDRLFGLLATGRLSRFSDQDKGTESAGVGGGFTAFRPSLDVGLSSLSAKVRTDI